MKSAAAATFIPSARTVGLEKAAQCARVAEDNKGKDILVLDMRGITPLYDFFVLVTGSSRRQIHTITEEIDAYLQGEGDKRLSIEGYRDRKAAEEPSYQRNRWVVQDYGDIVVHVFDEDARSYYALEELWADAPHVDWQRI